MSNIYKIHKCECCGLHSDNMVDELMIVSRKQGFAICDDCVEIINDALRKWRGDSGLGGNDDFTIISK